MLTRRRALASGSALVAAALAGQPAQAADARNALSALERRTGGRVGLYAANLHSGARLAWRADERFAMCSTFKSLLAAAVLARVDKGQERLDRIVRYGAADLLAYAPTARARLAEGGMPVGDLCAAAVELSDNTAANLLLARIGGPAGLTAWLRSTGDAVTRLDRTEPTLNTAIPGDLRDTTTPAAMAASLRRLLLGPALSASSRAHLTDWMLGCKTGDKRLRAGLPPGWRVADKTGNSGHDAAGDVAVAWTPSGAPVVICAYTMGGSPSQDTLDAAFAAIGALVGERLAA
jgi:beta-lactamase class A